MDRRAIFFLGAGAMSAVLIPETDNELRWVPTLLALIYVVLATASYFDWRSNNR
ncbi:MAG TPA: hypothetical protein VGP90_04040 [Acidimicrobiia bacterium]|jgi:hypothetical protein|nr:hypothetical protein [Acidimicrobiia bacterium]